MMRQRKIGDPLVCARCGTTDQNESRKGVWHIGTSQRMRCGDCADAAGLATLCWDCCPTGHGTHFPKARSHDNGRHAA